METSNILSADILDILFDGRNKTYGAYELRKTYHRRVKYSLAGMMLVCILLIAGSLVANTGRKSTSEVVIADVLLENVQDEKKPEPVQPPPKQDPPKVEMAQFTPPKIVQDEKVKPDEEIKEVQQLEAVKIGNINQEGVKDDGVVAPPVERGTSAEAPKVEEDYDGIFAVVQNPAEFPGGLPEWNKFLKRNLNSELPVENGAPPAKYTVIVSFIVAKDGSISNVTAENDPGYGTREEAIRVIQKGPKWVPALQNGRNVIYRHKQSIAFVVTAD